MMIQIVLSTSRLIPTETWCNPITKYIYFERELQSTKRWVWAKTSLTMKAVRVGPPGIQNKQTNGQFVLNLVLWGSSTRQCLLFFCFRPPIRRSLVQEVFKWRGAKREELWTRLREKKFSFVVPFAEWKNYLNTYYEKNIYSGRRKYDVQTNSKVGSRWRKRILGFWHGCPDENDRWVLLNENNMYI